MTKTTTILIIRRIWIFYLGILFAATSFAASPQYHVKDSGINTDLENLEHEVANHAHDGNGSVRIPLADPAPRTNLTPAFRGQMVFDQTALVICYATGTLNTQWALITSSATACPH